MSFNPFSAVAAKIFAAIAVALLLATAVQTVRLEGLSIWPVSIEGWKPKAERLAQERDDERAAHQQTKRTYVDAQRAAAELEAARLARVRSEQQEITDEVAADYRARLAAARTDYERLRDALARAGAGSAPGDEPVPAASDAARRSVEAAGDRGFSLEQRLIATEQAIQLDALIDWVEAQAAVAVDHP